MRHWTLARDADGIARLTLDKAGASANTLGTSQSVPSTPVAPQRSRNCSSSAACAG